MALCPHVIEIKGFLLPWTTGREQYCCCVLRLAAGLGASCTACSGRGGTKEPLGLLRQGEEIRRAQPWWEEELGLGVVGREEQGASACCLAARRWELGWSLREAAMEERRCHGWLHQVGEEEGRLYQAITWRGRERAGAAICRAEALDMSASFNRWQRLRWFGHGLESYGPTKIGLSVAYKSMKTCEN
ncbi:hypothetical protein ZEAMMB73_Zm00001d016064 [Zea mays]|uniref:Uncharacterized protein n=1 Tax=Zea mays TaxID=4577 RepID=A0A1D6H5A3_MAIZE|nr:hypothetical protein ZEAMMB73_Zm00001d016064 [Zea mays]